MNFINFMDFMNYTVSRSFWFLVLLFLPWGSFAQEYQACIEVRNLPAEASPVLLRIYNGNLFVVDSVPEHRGDSLIFQIPADTRTGMLKAILGNSPMQLFMRPPVSIDFLFTHENIGLSVDFNHPDTTLQVTASEENRLYFDFLRTDASFLQKLALLEQVIVAYPDRDEFYQKAKEYYKKIQIQRDKQINQIAGKHTDSFAGKIIRNMKLPIDEATTSRAVRDSLLAENFLSKVDFSDTLLLYTNVYTDKVFRYIQLFMKRDASPRENEANCIRAIDKLVPLLDVNPTVQQHLLQFLINGFEEMKMEEVLAHISEHYLQQCGGTADIIKQRLEAYHKMAIGQIVPDFTVYDIDAAAVNLYSQLDPYTLLLFWHTGCSHCQQLMQELLKMEKQQLFSKHQIRIIGISIDESEEDWKKFTASYPLDWINTREAGFESQIASDYNLFATPTMFLLDENHKILAKPTTIEELRKDIGKIE